MNSASNVEILILLISLIGLIILISIGMFDNDPEPPTVVVSAKCRFCDGAGVVFSDGDEATVAAWFLCTSCNGSGSNAHEFVWSESMEIWYCVNCTAYCHAGEPAPEPPCLWVRS